MGNQPLDELLEDYHPQPGEHRAAPGAAICLAAVVACVAIAAALVWWLL